VADGFLRDKLVKRGRMETRTGISGWVYPPWRGKFYPKEVTQKKDLHYASSKLVSIGINGSFYALQSSTSYKK
jgi:uncharacterized protein YecE (DUF72 family)